MPICALCHKNEADKTGSHLVPFFLMRTVDNVDNKKDRGLEFGFELGKGHVKGYFGGSVLPERLAAAYGGITEEDIAQSRSGMIVNNLLCSSCETRFGHLENFYSATLSKIGEGEYHSTDDSFKALLFWLSIFWRLSAAENKAYELAESDEHHLRIILDGGMDTLDIENYINRLGKEVKSIRYRVMRAPGYTKENPGWAFFTGENTSPYCFLVGEFAVFLYMDNMDTDDASQPFYGLEKVVLAAPLNDCQNGEIVLSVSKDILATACLEVVNFWKDDFRENISEICDMLHQKFIKNGSMDPNIKKQIMDEIAAEDKLMARQYAIAGVVDAITKVLMQHETYRTIGNGLI